MKDQRTMTFRCFNWNYTLSSSGAFISFLIPINEMAFCHEYSRKPRLIIATWPLVENGPRGM